MNDAALGISTQERGLAEALAGDVEALEALAKADPDGSLARRHRAGAALSLRATHQGVEPPAAWHRELMAMAASHLGRSLTVEEVGARLAAAGIGWVPIKGYDLATRFYETPEERPTADVDLLVCPERFEEACRALGQDGWEGLFPGPRNHVFLRDEGYAWMARKPGRTFLELHFRLWGLVPEGFAEALFGRSRADTTLGAEGRRLRPGDAYLVAAVHEWLTPPPRHLVAWWDLERIARRLEPEDVDEVVRTARDWDVQLPVALSARVSAALWGNDACREIERRLVPELALAERVVARWAGRRGLMALDLPRLQMARLLARRRSRQGWLGAWRRFWAHPGIVERATPDAWPWPLRRLVYQLRPLRRLGKRHVD